MEKGVAPQVWVRSIAKGVGEVRDARIRESSDQDERIRPDFEEAPTLPVM